MSSDHCSSTDNSSCESSICGEDAVAPSQEKIDKVFAHSTHAWQNLVKKAKAGCLRPETISLECLLHQLPKIPDDLRGVSHLAGRATFETSGSDRHTRAEEKRQWSLTVSRPTSCKVSDTCSYVPNLENGSNGILFLFFGWAYILCMAVLERQHIEMCYIDVPVPDEGLDYPRGKDFIVDIGHASPAELRWWEALLSLGYGWRSSSAKQPPWATLHMSQVRYRVVTQDTPAAISCVPPSSKEAAKYLSRFASMHGIGSQVTLALAMALTLPLHNATSSVVVLPRPSLAPITNPWDSSDGNINQEYDNLARYITLSSNPVLLSSTLWAVFWEPGIDANLVSPWCNAIINIVEPLVNNDNLQTLGHILALRRPAIAALWRGVLACGHTSTAKTIVPFLRNRFTPIDSSPKPEVAAWTGCPQSFMDLPGSGPYIRDGQVDRQDVWRLRHEFCDQDLDPESAPFKNPPRCPWPPFGSMSEKELELYVRDLAYNDRHYWVYRRWTWELENGITLKEESSAEQTYSYQLGSGEEQSCYSPRLGHVSNHRASEQATSEIFRWAATQMESSGKDIYSHPWVRAAADLELDGDEAISDTSQGSLLDAPKVQEWINQIETPFVADHQSVRDKNNRLGLETEAEAGDHNEWTYAL